MGQLPNPPLAIASLRGGMNNSDPAISLAVDECTDATNVEFVDSMLGERRNGCSPLTVVGAGFDALNVVVHLSQWYPTNDVTAPEWWAVGATAGTSVAFAKHASGGNWAAITPSDAALTAAPGIYKITNQPLSGVKQLNFFCYPTTADRHHVWDGASLRRAGLAQPSAPTAVDNGTGSLTGTRYYRIRYIEQDAATGKTVRRSEPSTSYTHIPLGTRLNVIITRPGLLSEGETHWELEASIDNANFYVLATTATIATATYTDATAYTTGYSTLTLSEAIGEYLLQPNALYMTVDGDRLILGGHFTDTTKQSTVWWSQKFNDPGVGNAERLPLSVNNSLVLDNGEGGAITGLASAVYGTWYVFKWDRIYAMTRTGDATTAYAALTLSTKQGAIPGSIFKGTDENGSPCIYFLDPLFGPSRVGAFGVQIIRGLQGPSTSTWARVNLQASLLALGTFYQFKRQAWWWIAVDGSDTPNLGLKLQTSEARRSTGLEVSRGWSLFDGRSAQAYCVGLLTQVATLSGVSSLVARPCIGLTTPDFIQRCDIGSQDAGQTYTASITSGPFMMSGLLQHWGAMVGVLQATANATTTVKVTLIRDMGVESVSVTTGIAAVGSETEVIKLLDNLAISSATLLQIKFSDP